MLEKVHLFFAASDMPRRDSNPFGNLCIAGLGVLLLIGNEFEKCIDFGHLCTYQFSLIFGGRTSLKQGCLDTGLAFQQSFRIKRISTVLAPNNLQYKPPCLRFATSFLEVWTYCVHTSKSDWIFCAIGWYSYNHNGSR